MATQGSEPNAKDDVLYYAVVRTGFADLATDLSQYQDNQVNGGTWTYEAAPASRFDVTDSWSAEFDADCDNADTGRFFQYDAAVATSDLSLRIAAGGIIGAIHNNTVLSPTLTLPGISGVDQRFIIAWAVERNLATTGAANALRFEIRAWNMATGAYAQAVGTTVVRASGTGTMTFWAATSAGASPFTGVPHAVRFGAGRFRTAPETRQDFVGLYTAPTITGATRIEYPIVDPACALQEAGQFAGPVLAMGAASVRSMALRCLSPIVNENFLERQTFTGAANFGGIGTSQFARLAPDITYTLFGIYTFYRPVPPSANQLQCRIQVQQWRTSGTTHDRIHYRVYTMNRPQGPTADVIDQNSAFQCDFASGSLVANHGSGAAAGAWLDLGLVDVVRNSEDCTWIALAVRVQNLSGVVGNQRFRISSLVVEPVVAE